jgi:hypothetical protein
MFIMGNDFLFGFNLNIFDDGYDKRKYALLSSFVFKTRQFMKI